MKHEGVSKIKLDLASFGYLGYMVYHYLNDARIVALWKDSGAIMAKM